MNENKQKKKVNRSVILWTLIGIACAAAFAFCIYCFAVVIPAKKEADRLALEEQRKQQELEQTMAPTATTVPTSEPTEAPIITEEPKATVAPTEVPDITEEPLPTNTPEPTATSTPIPTPTDVPHEHKWVAKEELATCTTGGRTWQECECGEIQNEVILEALGHGKLIYTVTKEPTTEADGKYEESCDICGTVVNKGNIKKLDPTPIPTATATPKPTATPTPKPTSTPIPTPTEVPHKHKWVAKDFPATCTNDGKSWEECECGETKNEVVREATGHGKLIYIVTKEPTTEAEGKYEEVCEICGTVANKGNIKKLDPTPIPTATATPTPKPTNTPTPKPTATPKPTNTPFPTPTTRPVVGTIQVNGETSITLTNMAPVEYTIFLAGNASSPELEYAIARDEILDVRLTKGNNDKQYTLKLQPNGMNGKTGIILTMYGTDEYGNRVACDEVILNVKVEIKDYDPVTDGYPIFVEKWTYEGFNMELWQVDKVGYHTAVLIINGEGKVTKDIRKSWTTYSNYKNSIEKIYFGEGITEISFGLPKENVTEVYLPSTLKIVGDGAFENANLKEVVLPEGLEQIGGGAFLRCNELEKVVFPSTLKYIGGSAFAYKVQTPWENTDCLKEITIPKSVEHIGYGAFQQRHGLVITLEKGIDTSGYEEGWNTSGYTDDLTVVSE